jgi:hypothetical protein
LPVATETARRFRSTEGDDHTPAPAGPQSYVPFDVFFSRIGCSAIVCDAQNRLPVCASYETKPPRNVQHG